MALIGTLLLLAGLVVTSALGRAADGEAEPVPTVTVPDTRRMTEAAAVAAVRAAGLVPLIEVVAADPEAETVSDPARPARVLGSVPGYGTQAAAGSSVTLLLEPVLVRVPDVRHRKEQKAVAAVRAAGLVPEVVMVEEPGRNEPSDPSRPVKAVGSAPGPGAIVARDTTVEIYFPAIMVEVPDTRQMTEAEAVEMVRAAGLIPLVEVALPDPDTQASSEPDRLPRILGSVPRYGTLAAEGSSVTLLLEPVRDPDAGIAAGMARLVHTLSNLAPDEQGSTELVCTYQGRANLEMDGGWWSITYTGQNWHSLEGAAFVCGGDTGESVIVRGSYTLEPLTFTLDDAFVCDLDDLVFDGTTISGVRHEYCGDGNVYEYAVTVDANG